MHLKKLALCTYILLQDAQVRLGGDSTEECRGFFVAFVIPTICL